MPFSFNAVELCVVTINEKPWTGAREMCSALRYEKKLWILSKIIVVRKTTPRSINWAVYTLRALLWIGLKTHKKATFTLMKKGCMSYFFQVSILRQKIWENTALMYCFLMFGSSLVISHMTWKLNQWWPKNLRIRGRGPTGWDKGKGSADSCLAKTLRKLSFRWR